MTVATQSPAAPTRSPRRRPGLRRFLRNPVAVTGLVVLLLIVIVTVFGPLVDPHNPAIGNILNSREPPSAEHWLGTDDIGRDMLSRLLAGGRVSLTVGFLSAGIAVGVGTLVGVIAGWFGGVVDAVLSRLIDIMLSLPLILVVLVFAGVIGGSVTLLITLIALLSWPQSARIARSVVLGLHAEEFVQAARVLGSRTRYIIWHHLLPAVLPPVVVAATLLVAEAILAESALSFLGAGVQPPQASWGNMLTSAESITVMSSMPWMWIPPGVMIAVTVLSAMAVGDGVRDAIDTRKNS